MNMFGVMETSASALEAERMRAEVVAANMANVQTTRTATGGPYRRQELVFAADRGDANFLDSLSSASDQSPAVELPGDESVAPGVHIAAVVEDPSPPIKRYDPGNPDANAQGYVSYPNINPITEMVDLMGATRAYGLNSSAVQAEKGMIESALDIAKA